MKEKIDIIEFSEKIKKAYLKYISPIAKRCGISGEAAIELVFIFKNSQYNSKESLTELKKMGYINVIKEDISLTAKGAIVAKSLTDYKDKFNQVLIADLNPQELESILKIFDKM